MKSSKQKKQELKIPADMCNPKLQPIIHAAVI